MKKTVKLFIFTLIVSLFSLIKVNAASLSFDGDRTISGGNTGTNDININVGSEEKINKVEFTISTTDSSLVNLNLLKEPSFAGTPNLNKTILSIDQGFFASGEIATLRITNNNIINTNAKTNIIISNIVFFHEGGSTSNGTNYTKEITLTPGTTTRTPSSNAKLTGLTVSSGTLTPAFNASTTSYKVINLKDTIKSVTLTPKCDNCNYKIICELSTCTNYSNQNKPELIIGKNVLKIETISEDGGSSAEYELIIYRGETTDNSAFLANLEINDFRLGEKFNKDLLDYTITVPNDATFLEIIATPEDENAQIEIKGADDLMVGENVITITVTSAETKDKKIYNITVTRLAEDEVMPTTNKAIDPISKKGNNTLLIIILVIVSLVIIGVSGYFIFIKKKKKGEPEIITEDEEINIDPVNTEIEVKENDLIDELNITDKKERPTVDEALADLMTTKEIILKEE